MNVYSYSDLRYTTGRATGVYKHIDRVVHGLAASPGIDLRVAVSRDQWKGPAGIAADNALAGLPANRVPLSNKEGRLLWGLSSKPGIDRWLPEADWVYSPQELLVPTGKAKSAVTLHGMTYFEEAVGRAVYNSQEWRRGRARLGWFLKRVKETADVIFCVSDYLREQAIERFGFPGERMVTVGNGVEELFFEEKLPGETAPAEAEGRPYILSVGGLNAFDGGQVTLDTAARIQITHPDMLVLVAGHQHDEELLKQAQSIPSVRVLGFVESLKLARLMRNAEALLALAPVESFGIVPLEAMASRCPVIFSNSTALPHVVKEAGMKVPAGDSNSAANALTCLLESRDLGADYRERGRAHAKTHQWEQVTRHVSETLKVCAN